MLPPRNTWLAQNHHAVIDTLNHAFTDFPEIRVTEELCFYSHQHYLKGVVQLGRHQGLIKISTDSSKDEIQNGLNLFFAQFFLRSKNLELMRFDKDTISFKRDRALITINPKGKGIEARIYDAVSHRFNITAIESLLKEELKQLSQDDDLIFVMDEDSKPSPRGRGDVTEEVYVKVPYVVL